MNTPTNNPILTEAEIEQLADRLANALEYDTTNLSLLLILLDHLSKVREERLLFHDSVDAVKRQLFIDTAEAAAARKRFESKAIASRDKILPFRQKQTG